MSRSMFLAVVGVVFVVSSCLAGRLPIFRTNDRLAATKVGSQPACYVNTQTAWAQCQYLTSNDIGLLQNTIANISMVDPTFNVAVSESDSTAFPDTLFSGYGVLEIDMQQDGFTAMPATILGNVGPQLTSLDLSVNAITTISAVVAQYAATVQTVDLSYNGASVLNDDAFTGYTSLVSLYLDNNALTTIGAPFAGLTSLGLLGLASNSISSISPTAFTDLVALEYLELSANQLTTLTDGTFTSLNSIVQVSLGGNPFDCTCDLQWLKDWLNSKNLLAKSRATCATPTAGAFADIEFCPAK